MKRVISTAVASAALLAGAQVASAATWEPYPLPPPPGGSFSTPVGYVGDISFWAPNRGLMIVGGNNSVEAGLYGWNGASWRQLSTVCGGGINSRIAWAGPTEFWTITAPSVGSYRQHSGLGLCHFKDGAVVGSYSFFNLPEFGNTLTLNAATCRTADDCLFGGVAGVSPDGSRSGAFHLRWDGSTLTPLWNGQGRGVSGLTTHRGTVLESVFVGPQAAAQGRRPALRVAEPVPALLHTVAGGAFANDPFVPTVESSVPADGGVELRAIDSDGSTAWAVGGGAGSGPAALNGYVQARPLAVRRTDGGWTQVPLTGELPTDSWFGAVAAVPGTHRAWASLTQFETADLLGNPAGDSAPARIAAIAEDGSTTVETLSDGAARGTITAIGCATAGDCWAATARGHLYRRTDRAAYPVDVDPAFQGTISVRPNEAAAQVIPDEPPADDSRLFAPPVELPQEAEEAPVCGTPPRLVSRVRSRTAKLTRSQKRAQNPRIRVTVSFRLARRARVGLVARRGKKVVARAKARTLKAGNRKVTFRVRRKSWPKSLKFSLKELTTPVCESTGDDVLSTGEDTR